jgi:hypothetical protein
MTIKTLAQSGVEIFEYGNCWGTRCLPMCCNLAEKDQSSRGYGTCMQE